MSLLYIESEQLSNELAQAIFDRQFQKDRKLVQEYDDRRKRSMLKDISCNLNTLDIAIKYQSEKIFNDNADWIVKLLFYRMKDLSHDRIKQQMITHYQTMLEVLQEEMSREYSKKAELYLTNAMKVTEQAVPDTQLISYLHQSANETGLTKIRAQYMDSLLKGDKHSAHQIIDETVEQGYSLIDIYSEVFQKAMVEVGELWHIGEISVDKEHYFTAVTQSVMSKFYPQIFSTPRIGRTAVACCVGNELHEMGVRMLCDIMELYGWDSIYLGAAVPKESIISSVIENKPDMLLLSVTMPNYLNMCQDIIAKLKADEQFQDLKIAVGGRALNIDPHLAERLEADVWAASGVELAEWAKTNLI